MRDQGLVVHYRVLAILGIDWESAIEDAATAVRRDGGPVQMNPDDGSGVLLNFILYPANLHTIMAEGDEIESALKEIAPTPTSRVVLAACQPTYPELDEAAVNDLASIKLGHISKKNVIRSTQPNELKLEAERYLRLGLRQLGVSAPDIDSSTAITDDPSSLFSYEASTWRY